MNNNLTKLAVALVTFLVLWTGLLFFWDYGIPSTDPELQDELRLYLEVRKIIQDEYVQETSDRKILTHALKSVASSLDPYSDFYSREELADLQQETSGKFVGIGILIDSAADPITVLFPQPGGPAEKAGLKVGDQIVAIDDEDVASLPYYHARDKIRGEEGSQVKLSVKEPGKEELKEITLTRTALADPTIGRIKMLEEEHGIGYLKVHSFSQETTKEFDIAVQKLLDEGMKSLIVDLRFNTGGVLSSTVDMANRFISEGTIVSTKGRHPKFSREMVADPEKSIFKKLPLVVLVNGESASASEVFAGAIQDYRVGVLVGTTTYGKGVVQTLKPVGDDTGIFKLTTSFFYTPANRNFEKRLGNKDGGGIKPDLVVKISDEEEKDLKAVVTRYDIPDKYRDAVLERYRMHKWPIGVESDKQLDAAIAVLKENKTPAEFR